MHEYEQARVVPAHQMERVTDGAENDLTSPLVATYGNASTIKSRPGQQGSWRSAIPVLSVICMISSLLFALLLGEGQLHIGFSYHLPEVTSSVPVPFWDTEGWVGAEYTPSTATNELWWHNFTKYEAEVVIELQAARKHLGFSALRMFLHSQLFYAAPDALMDSMDRFLSIAHSNGIQVGFVFFDDCWAHAGADVEVECVPVKGRHNGCWMASPQDIERTTTDRFRLYIQVLVQRFAKDPRVLFWEIFNEPTPANFTQELRKDAYGWAKAMRPAAPVISCWDDSNYTDIVNVHRYDSWFPNWSARTYLNPAKGGVVTEAGARWWQGRQSVGSPLEVIAWLQGLKHQSPPPPFIPGVFINWELMVGNTNTRWCWATPDGSPEPVVPYHGHLFPDGSPVSLTEAAAIRNWTLKRDDFLFYEDFLPPGFQYDSFLTLTAKISWGLAKAVHEEFVLEASIWPEDGQTVMAVHLQESASGHYALEINTTSAMMTLRRVAAGQPAAALAAFNISTLDCGLGIQAWNILRVAVHSDGALHVWLNNMWLDAFDTSGSKQPIKPRLAVMDRAALPKGNNSLLCVSGVVRVDYVSMLPLSLL